MISGDTYANRKPHPEPVLRACGLLEAAPQQCWYIGDAGRDIEAGNAAGCTTVGALYGYLHPDDPPDRWQSDMLIKDPHELLTLLSDGRQR